MEEQEISDEMLTRIASKAGGIKPLLDTFFSFLERKTDFYVQFDASDKTKAPYKMGFPEGVAEKMVLQAFRQHKLKDYDVVMGHALTSRSTVSPTSTPTKSTPSKNTKTNLPPQTPPRTPAGSVLPPSTPLTNKPKTQEFTPSYTPEGKQIPIGNGGIGGR